MNNKYLNIDRSIIRHDVNITISTIIYYNKYNIVTIYNQIQSNNLLLLISII